MRRTRSQSPLGVLCTQGHWGDWGQSKACMSKGEAWWNANTGMSPLPQVGWGLPLGPAFDGVRRRLPCAPCPPRSCGWCGVKAGPGPFPTQFLGLLPLLYVCGGSPSVPSCARGQGSCSGGCSPALDVRGLGPGIGSGAAGWGSRAKRGPRWAVPASGHSEAGWSFVPGPHGGGAESKASPWGGGGCWGSGQGLLEGLWLMGTLPRGRVWVRAAWTSEGLLGGDK